MNSLMVLQEFLDRHGSRPERWPQGERGGVMALIATDPAARRVWEDALAFDRTLGAALAGALPLPHAGARQALAAQGVGSGFGRSHGWASAALAASLLLGLVVGRYDLGPGLVGWGGDETVIADQLGLLDATAAGVDEALGFEDTL